jgi:glycosyltransferase involved in cell wall biosynthesis
VSRIQVLYVHHRPQLGGAPLSLAELIRRLDDRFEPHAYLPAGPAAELLAEAGAEVHTGPVAIFGHTWDNPYSGRRWLLLGREAAAAGPHLRSLGRVLRRHRFSIVHVNDSVLLPAGALGTRAGAAVVWHLRSSLAANGPVRRRAVLAALERWGDAAIAIDSDVARSFPLHLPLEVVPNGVTVPADAPSPADAKRALGLPEDRLAIGFVGNIRCQKGWPEFVEAAALLEAEAAHFVVLGGGVRPPEWFAHAPGRILSATGLVRDEETLMRELVAQRGLEGRFTFVPPTSRPERVYPALDVVAFPNQGLGLGRPVLEAAAFGKPVVASGSEDGAGILVPDVTGILLDHATPDALAAALRRLVRDAALVSRLGEAAARHARATFGPEPNARAVQEVYDGLIAGGAAPTATEAT